MTTTAPDSLMRARYDEPWGYNQMLVPIDADQPGGGVLLFQLAVDTSGCRLLWMGGPESTEGLYLCEYGPDAKPYDVSEEFGNQLDCTPEALGHVAAAMWGLTGSAWALATADDQQSIQLGFVEQLIASSAQILRRLAG